MPAEINKYSELMDRAEQRRITPLTALLLIFGAIDRRVLSLEAQSFDWQQAVSTLTSIGLQQISEVLAPAQAEIQAALDEVNALLAALEGGGITAELVSVDPVVGLAATNVQAALPELLDKIADEVAALVDSSPATLDTLNELAAALGDDPNFATSIAAELASKAPLTAVQNVKLPIWIPARSFVPRATNGPTRATAIELATNKGMLSPLDFANDVKRWAQADIVMPKGWNRGTISAAATWYHDAAATNFGVQWGFDAVAIGDGEALDVAFGTEQTSVDTGGATQVRYRSPESAGITVAGSLADHDYLLFRVNRDPAAAGDTLAVSARLLGVTIFYTAATLSDA
jgi:hypothetical protein